MVLSGEMGAAGRETTCQQEYAEGCAGREVEVEANVWLQPTFFFQRLNTSASWVRV